jgi:hypothetical protein
MSWKSTFVAAPAIALGMLVAVPLTGIAGTAHAACEPGDRVNSSTADWAAKKAQAADYSQVRMDHKGCDNYWHGMGEKDGQPARFVVSPEGEVLPERD